MSSSYCYGLPPSSSTSPKQIGVIKPMTRGQLINKDMDSTLPAEEDGAKPILSSTELSQISSQSTTPQTTTALNKLNSAMSQVAAIRAAAAKPAAEITETQLPAQTHGERTSSTNFDLISKNNADKPIAEHTAELKQPQQKEIATKVPTQKYSSHTRRQTTRARKNND